MPKRWAREGVWLAPFLCLGLMALVPARPWPTFPPPAQYRTVTDANGTAVTVPVPLRGVVAWIPDFLSKTHAPDRLLKLGDPRDRAGFAASLFGKLFPQLVKKDDLWTPDDGTLESTLAHERDNSVYTSGGDARLGMITFSDWPGGPITSADETIFAMTRSLNTLLGQEERGEALIARYQGELQDLQGALQPQTLADRPSILGMVSPSNDWSRLSARGGDDDSRAGATDGTKGWAAMGRYDDAERILAMDPDIVILWVGEARAFLRDPRWQGLKAVRDGRVYSHIGPGRYTFDLDNVPLATRWLAEIAHPDRLQPRVRELLRDHYRNAYGYSLSDAEMDDLLNIQDNRDSAGYVRFMATGQGVSP